MMEHFGVTVSSFRYLNMAMTVTAYPQVCL